MTMYDNFMDILDVIRNDETLLRLLYYPPIDYVTNFKDPLDESLDNILDMSPRKLNEIRDEHIVKSAKLDDLTVNKKICRLYLYFGRRVPERGNYLVAKQRVTFDIFCHNDIENADLRLERISDRLNELLVGERITGIGKIDYVDGRPISAPEGFVAFQHVYHFGSVKK